MADGLHARAEGPDGQQNHGQLHDRRPKRLVVARREQAAAEYGLSASELYAHRVEPAQHGDDPEVDEGQRGDEQGRLQKRGEPALPGCAPQPPCNAHEPEHGRRQEALLHDRGGAERDEPEGARGGARTLEPCLEQDQTSRDQHDPVDGVRGHEGEDVEVDQYCPRGAEHVRQAPRGGRTAVDEPGEEQRVCRDLNQRHEAARLQERQREQEVDGVQQC